MRARYGGNLLGQAASLEMLALLAWLIFPLARTSWPFLLVIVAAIGPGFIIADHLGGPLAGGLLVGVWGFWLVSIWGVSWRFWSIPYWIGVVTMAALLLIDDLKPYAPG
jgi:hypothetical protein